MTSAQATQQAELQAAIRDQMREDMENATRGNVDENLLGAQQESLSGGLDQLGGSGGLAEDIQKASEEITNAFQTIIDGLSDSMKVFAGYLQVLSSFTLSLPSIAWPEGFSALCNIIGPINVDFGRLLPVECYVPANAYSMFLFHSALPLIMVLLLSCVGMYYNVTMSRETEEENEEYEKSVDSLWGVAMFGAFILYPMVSQQALFIFHCRQIGHDYWLYNDIRLQC